MAMTKEQIKYAIATMKVDVNMWYEGHHLQTMIPKMEEMSEYEDWVTREQLMRWIGFMQGVLWIDGHYTVDDLRAMNTKEL